MVIAGPSGAGKSTIVTRLLARHPFRFSVSVTTRPPRPDEVDGVHYQFIELAVFTDLIENGDLLEWAEYGANLYGTPRAPVLDRLSRGEDIVLEIDIQGARQVHAGYPDAVMFFIAPPSLDVLEHRLGRRGDTAPDAIVRRLEIANVEMAAAPTVFDHIVINRDIDEAVAEVEGLLDLR